MTPLLEPRMPHFFSAIDAELFHQRIEPVLSRCRRTKSFAPGQAFFTELLPRIKEFHASYHGLAGATLLEQAAEGLSFDPAVWRAVVGEVLLFAAEEVPLLQLSLETLCHLLGGARECAAREQFTLIQQVLFGSRDLVFGGHCYRPDLAGYNDLNDVHRLTNYLLSVDTTSWQPADLAAMKDLPDDEERAEELEFVRQGWPGLTELYQRASVNRQIVACESE
jgi:hypothetical protein